MKITPTFKDSQQAFEQAIAAKRLNLDPLSPLYAANWMYMGTWAGKDAFKNINTREYLR